MKVIKSLAKDIRAFRTAIRHMTTLFDNLRILFELKYSRVNKKTISLSFSNLTFTALEILKKNGYIKNFKREKNKIIVSLTKPKPIKHLVVSQVHRPIYLEYERLEKSKNTAKDLGLIVFTTSEGLCTYPEMLEKKLGGLFLFRIM